MTANRPDRIPWSGVAKAIARTPVGAGSQVPFAAVCRRGAEFARAFAALPKTDRLLVLAELRKAGLSVPPSPAPPPESPRAAGFAAGGR